MPGTGDIDVYDSRRSTVYAREGIVATSQPLAAESGIQALRAGGNAFDAAVTTAAVLNVVEPFSTGIGGDVFALYRTADGDVGALRAMGSGPIDASLDKLRGAVDGDDRGDTPELPERGPLTVTPPGAARGWERTVDDLGERSFAAALAPAIEYAREGFPVTEVIASQWSDWADALHNDHARELYLPDGDAPDPGEIVRLPALADTFERVQANGADAMYEGDIGERIVETVRSRGGFLSMEDLASVEAEYVDPISTTYAGAEVFELPAPNQGPIALEALNVASEVGAGSYPDGSVEGTHRYVEAFKRAFHDGHQYVTDPTYESLPPLTQREWAAKRAATIGDEASDTVSPRVPGSDRAEDADTVLLTVADDEGNVVSFINSIFTAFGSGLAADGTGVLLQSRGASFSLDPDHPNRFQSGKLPFHTLVPAVAKFGQDDWAAFGVMGGYMQPQGHLQVLSALLDHDASLQEALDRPRWRYRSDGHLAVEARFDDHLTAKLVRRGHEVAVEASFEFGGGQIVRARDGVLSGATDPRKDGSVVGF
ncbi:gamma-glutamyltransferase [Halorubrum sp. CBA1125]|uniref:gamma-glutamyltransferase family protein n=1 Tax=Halorubrum sp. CBA1125 TaxID=2668072 RepID=UPI0012E7629E|nr:gamma-glutamyltransferase family protein [Halorubrum sp. CBA1125]MUW13683.1 gamma-glutamyltransferase [Halorubrum sp. CBA1125]